MPLPPTIVVKKPLSQIKTIQELLSSEVAYKQLSSVIAKQLNPEQMMRVVANAVRVTPTLQKCDPMSFLGALMTSAQLALIPNTVLGHAYLVPFWSSRRKCYEVQLIVGYKGYIDLAYRSGKVLSVHADAVYDDDDLWDYEQGSLAHIRHRRGPREGQPTHAYCCAKVMHEGMTHPDVIFEVLTWADVLRTREKSQGWRKAVKDGKEAEHPWHESQYLNIMAAKTAVRYTANRGAMPMSIDYIHASSVDDQLIDYSQIALGEEEVPLIESEPEAPQDPQPEEAKAAEKEPVKRKGRPPKAKEPEAPKAEDAPPEDYVEQLASIEPDHDAILTHKIEMVMADVRECRRGQEIENLMGFYRDTLEEIEQIDGDAYNAMVENIANVKAGLPR